jgi:hypothetical protein
MLANIYQTAGATTQKTVIFEIIVAQSENYTNAQLSIIKANGTYSSHWAFKGRVQKPTDSCVSARREDV